MNHNHIVVIFNIPLALQQEVLGSWLTMKDVAKMDSAICSRASRPVFLDLLSNEDMVLSNSIKDRIKYGRSLAWMVARKVSVTVCHLYSAVDPAIYKPFFARAGKKLKVLTIESSKNDEENTINQLLRCAAAVCANVEEISLKDFSTVSGLETLLQSSQKTICNLKLCNCNLSGFQVGDCELPSLRHLSIDYCQNITNTTLEQLSRSACKLEILTCFYLSHWSANMTFSSNLRVFAVSTTNITDTTFCSLIHSCPLLEVVQLVNCQLLTGVSIIELVQHAKHLNALYLSSNRNFSDGILEAIAVHCGERLKHFCLYNCIRITDAGLHHISKCCHNLKVLGIDFFHRNNISGTAVQALLQSNPLLQEVSLNGSDRDGQLATLGRSCPQLRHLNICFLDEYTEWDIIDFMPTCTKLEEIYTNPDCTIINEVVKHLWQAHYCPQLDFLLIDKDSLVLPFWAQYKSCMD